MLYTECWYHSWLLSGDADRSCSMFGRDFVVGGEDVADGGDVVSAPSRAASALKAFVLDSSFLSFSFTGGVPVRLLFPLSSRWDSRLAEGPRVLRGPLFVRPLRRLVGPKEPGPAAWLGFLEARLPSRRKSSVPILLEV